MHGSNSTKVGEYLIGSLLEENMFVHNSFSQHMRLVTKGFLPAANVDWGGNPARMIQRTPQFAMNYSYFIGYNRTVLRWDEDRRIGKLIPDDLKAAQARAFHTLTANGFRMSLHLMIEAAAQGAPAPLQSLDPIKVHFDTYQPEHRVADLALLNAARAAMGDAGRY
jgi:hypothetical protein